MKTVKKKNQLKIVIFTAVKNICILHGCDFVMNDQLYGFDSRVRQTFCHEAFSRVILSLLLI